MKCSNCGNELKPGWQICPFCGQKAEEKNLCPGCGEEVEANWSKCPFCGADLKKPKKDIGFNFDELDELNDAFDKQLQEEENLNRAKILCIRGEYERALKIYEDYIDKHYDRIEGYIGLVRVYSKDYTIYEGEQIDNAVRTVERLFKKAQIADEEYNNYISSKKKYSSDKKVIDAEAEKKRLDDETADMTEEVRGYYLKATNGDAGAQLNLGCRYDKGDGVEQSYTKAVYWYTKAAEQGNATAQCNLGNCFRTGKGAEQDYKQAAYWYSKAAGQGNARAQLNFGNCYEYGIGVGQDYNKAVYWYTKSAEQGNDKAQYNLGLCYYRGQGVGQDKAKAKYWLTKAAEQGSGNAARAKLKEWF